MELPLISNSRNSLRIVLNNHPYLLYWLAHTSIHSPLQCFVPSCWRQESFWLSGNCPVTFLTDCYFPQFGPDMMDTMYKTSSRINSRSMPSAADFLTLKQHSQIKMATRSRKAPKRVSSCEDR